MNRKLSASFRDPAGFVFTRDGTLYRQINQIYRDHYDRLIASGLYEELIARGWLVAHDEVAESASDPGLAYKVVRPERIGFISYPYEWAFSQLKDAALLTLDVQLLAMEHGLSLKDASAFNIQFRGGRPVHIDTLSFEIYREGRPWPAYRQFCQHFLAPLALMARSDVRLGRLLQTWIDGVPLDLASRLLPRRTWWHPGLAIHLHLHARTQRAWSSTRQTRARRELNVSRRGLSGLLQGLRKLVARLDWSPEGTEWVDYYQATNYSEQAFTHKQELVSEYLLRVNPTKVWDLGANTGIFSRLAAQAGAATVAFDVDPAAVERHYRQVKQTGQARVLPLLLDLTNPSPGLGWAGAERDSLRGRGPVDCVMALALIHHLAIGNNVPLPQIAAFFAELGTHLIIEFVPKTDGQVQRLLRAREDIFGEYDQAHFEAAFAEQFMVERTDCVRGTDRTLYLMKKRTAS